MGSMTVTVESGQTVEAVTVGNDGFIGIPAFLDERIPSLDTFIQIEGQALRMPVQSFRQLMDDDCFRQILASYTANAFATLAQSLACNTFHTVEKRLAKWLLMASYCTERPDLPLTQEFLAIMLGAQRPTVTIAVGALKDAGLIENRRGSISIIDARGLVDAACECYGAFIASRAGLAHR